jgi:drug/metabolite transporter (DMT)-like permease
MTTIPLISATPAPRWQIALALASIYLIWGSTYLAIGVAVETMPPLLMAGARFLLAGALLYGAMRWRGEPAPSAEQWRSAAIVGTLLLLGGNGLVCLAERSVISSLAALLVATVPLWMVLLPWAIGSSRPPLRTLLALATGLAGVALLTMGGQGQGVDPLGAALLIAATLSWAIGSLWSRQLRHAPSPLVSTSLQMLCGGAALLVLAVLVGDVGRLDPHAMTAASLASFAYLVTVGSIVGFGSYVFLLRHTSATLATSYSYVNPLVALALGCLLHHEPLGASTPLAALLIVGAVVVMSRPAPAVAPGNTPGAAAHAPILPGGRRPP